MIVGACFVDVVCGRLERTREHVLGSIGGGDTVAKHRFVWHTIKQVVSPRI